ncbi:hypothetical protein VSH64_21385 [Amycolatopsis rhabdoformis]|uniref:Immunity protein 35 domain-containing protein n=1 Tax=Amycolatopsis rhabdoformis TaxID=1448059 RepID=A0ABZ1IJG8_9PSEU|nr:hypothetical protein [Amycolatopsis rhabdoformis]WSE34604.1 hypothetical protein VSH64_21385 [Amycolatopsis rhabdoformis]
MGFFAELEERRPDVFRGSVFEVISRNRDPHESNLVAYLQGGRYLMYIMEGTRDVIANDGSGVSGGSSLMTDGIWVWRLDLPYLVKKHHLELDPEFVWHAAGNRYVVPEIPDERMAQLAPGAAWEIYGMRKLRFESGGVRVVE